MHFVHDIGFDVGFRIAEPKSQLNYWQARASSVLDRLEKLPYTHALVKDLRNAAATLKADFDFASSAVEEHKKKSATEFFAVMAVAEKVYMQGTKKRRLEDVGTPGSCSVACDPSEQCLDTQQEESQVDESQL